MLEKWKNGIQFHHSTKSVGISSGSKIHLINPCVRSSTRGGWPKLPHARTEDCEVSRTSEQLGLDKIVTPVIERS